MPRSLILLALLGTLSLAACGDGEPIYGEPAPTDPDPDPVDPDPDPVDPDPDAPLTPEDIAGNLASATYAPGAGSIQVQIYAADGAPVLVTYQRDPSLDVGAAPGAGVTYEAYSVQDDQLDRVFTALAARSTDGQLQAELVADGGQFNTHYGGATVERVGAAPVLPTSGLVSYAGTYAGLTNIGIAVPVPGGADPSLYPERSARIAGNVFVNTSFDDGTVEGSIYSRRIEPGAGFPDDGALPTVILMPAEITAGGTFAGDVNPFGDPSAIGGYAGTFGGSGATSMAGAVLLENHLGANSIEHGVFVLTLCGQPSDPSICDVVNP